MLLRLSGIENKDMVAADCRYHWGNKMCLSVYLGLHIKKQDNRSNSYKSETKSSDDKSSDSADNISDPIETLSYTPEPSDASKAKNLVIY